ncbi:MAG: hypothetical protein WB290_09130, partial [Smithella sp.]
AVVFLIRVRPLSAVSERYATKAFVSLIRSAQGLFAAPVMFAIKAVVFLIRVRPLSVVSERYATKAFVSLTRSAQGLFAAPVMFAIKAVVFLTDVAKKLFAVPEKFAIKENVSLIFARVLSAEKVQYAIKANAFLHFKNISILGILYLL